MRTLTSVTGILLLLFALSSCQKKSSNNNTIVIPGTFNSLKVSGVVIDQNGNPLENALIKLGTSTTTSGSLGKFEIEGTIAADKNATVIVEKSGYFNSSRSFTQQTEGFSYIKIALMTKAAPSVINGANGGVVITNAGLQLVFPAGAFVTDNGSAYTGPVNVYTSYICPDSVLFRYQMPGWLLGRDSTNTNFSLRSFGMAGVEIETSAGSHLKIAPGKKVSFTLPIVFSQRAASTPQIPLWYWSDSTGVWIQEGIALRNASGNAYTGDMKHFTFWNFDAGYTPIRLKAKFVSPNGTPIPQKAVEIRLSSGNLDDYTITNEAGKIDTWIVKNYPFELRMVDDCGQVLYTQNLGLLTADTDLGTITVNNIPPSLTIKGKLVDCNNAPVRSGTVFIKMLNARYFGEADTSGNFNVQIVGCLSVNQFSLTGINKVSNEQSIAQTIQVNNQAVINTGNVAVCNNVGSEFIQIIRATDTFNFRYPECTTIFGATSQPVFNIDSSRTNIFALRPASLFYSGLILNHVPANFTAPGTMYLFNVNITNADSIPNYIPALNTRPLVNITEYGAVGQYIAGNFTGQLQRDGYFGLYYNFKVSFRVKRTQ